MIFYNRQEAAVKLLTRLKQDDQLKKWGVSNLTIVSLLRGGSIIGDIISRGFKINHFPLAVVKIPAPHNPELAIGALCFNVVYLEKEVLASIMLNKYAIDNQIKTARKKFNLYKKRFNIKNSSFSKLKSRHIVLVDDGIATGSTIKVSVFYLKSKKPKSITLAVPVAPSDFDIKDVDRKIILYQDSNFCAVSQFYKNFPQITDAQMKKIIKKIKR